MKRGLITIAVMCLVAGCKQDFQDPSTTGCLCGTPETPSQLACDTRNFCEGNFQLVGHDDLGARGMNSALAIAGNYAYVGSRTDGVTHEHAGVAIVDITNPMAPQQVGELGPPDSAVLGLSARELRAVPDKHWLLVLDLICNSGTDCSLNLDQFPGTGGVAENENLKIFDITDPTQPALIGRIDFHNNPASVPYVPPHEFFLWRDPKNPDRVLLYVSLVNGPPSLEVFDISDPANPALLATWDLFDNGGYLGSRSSEEILHSVSVSDDGAIVYVAHFGTGFFMLDSTDIAMALPDPTLRLLTPIGARIDYSPPYYPGTHSALKVPNRPLALLTDEVYPIDIGAEGCPWGWAWLIDISNPALPKFLETTDHATGSVTTYGQMRLSWNEKDRCPPEAEQHRINYSAHNPTLTENLAVMTWYGGGLQVFDTSDAENPVQVGAFFPEALPSVALEDPTLQGTKTLMWSYPIIKDGLIYVADIRNGLYVLRYTGPRADEVTAISFREGNSNLQ